LDFYIEAISNEIMHSSKQKWFRSYISKQELQSVQDPSQYHRYNGQTEVYKRSESTTER
jgi:hypothetical protein